MEIIFFATEFIVQCFKIIIAFFCSFYLEILASFVHL